MLLKVFIVLIIVILLWGALHDRKVERNSTRRCRHCGQVIPYKASRCPYCLRNPGADWHAAGNVGRKSSGAIIAKWFVIIMAVLFVAAILIGR